MHCNCFIDSHLAQEFAHLQKALGSCDTATGYRKKMAELFSLAALKVQSECIALLEKDARQVEEKIPVDIDMLFEQQAGETIRTKLFEAPAGQTAHILQATSKRTMDIETRVKRIDKMMTTLSSTLAKISTLADEKKAERFDAVHMSGKKFAAIVRATHLIIYTLPGVREKVKRSPMVRGFLGPCGGNAQVQKLFLWRGGGGKGMEELS